MTYPTGDEKKDNRQKNIVCFIGNNKSYRVFLY